MAHPNLSNFKTPTKSHLSLSPSPCSTPFFSLRSLTQNAKPTTSLSFPTPPLLTSIRCSSNGSYEHDRVVHPRPPEIPWSKELANTVHLIGIVGAPVQIKHLSSGKALAWTRLAVKKSATDTTWINLTFWDELALVAFQHVEKGNQVYISGRLVSDSVEGEEEKPKVYYKVVAQELNFIERNMPAVALYEPNANFATSGVYTEERFRTSSGAKAGDYVGNRAGSTEELWQAFFANPVDWWDNRNNKRNPKAPDFKHKDTGEALWLEGKYNPPWVKSQLAILDTRMGSLQPNGTRTSTSLMYGDDFSPF